ncbi:MAG TPA: cell division protein ZapA [Caulobacteraceae bacterium]|jgi:cell division protein ZapA|nr:cell division protein ZapA [Caulobacteraceae bacterium]
MAQVTIHINGKAYLVGCEDGEEARLKGLAAALDDKIQGLGVADAALGETRLMLMGALVLADEMSEMAARVAAAEAQLSDVRGEIEAVETRAAQALEAAAKKIESLAARQT